MPKTILNHGCIYRAARRYDEVMDPANPGARVAFFGGSFDPPHIGHLAVARAARDALRLDAVLFTPVGTQPLKPMGSSADFDDRLAMTRLAIAGERGFEASLMDAPRASAPSRPNYTFDTLSTLRLVLPQETKLFCLVGADSFLNLRFWHRAAKIPFKAELIVASRPGEPLDDFAAALPNDLALEPLEELESNGVKLIVYSISDTSGQKACLYLLPGLDFDISATEIRANMSAAEYGMEDGNNRLPATVAEYIREHGLYR